MQILITGGTGLIGSSLCKHFKLQNHTVKYLTRNKKLAKKNADAYIWDIEKKFINDSCMDNIDVIIHLAGARISNSWSKKGKEKLRNSRINSTRLLYETIAKKKNAKIKHMLCASAIGIYQSNTETIQYETLEIEEKSFLSRLTQDWEEESRRFEKLGIKTTIMRFGHVFSNKGGFYPILNFFLFNRIGFILGNGEQIYSWIHITDLMNIIECMIEKKWSKGVYNMTAPNWVSQKRIMQTIIRYKKNKSMLLCVPELLIKLILQERSQLILDGQKISGKKVQDAGYKFKFPDIDSCIKNLETRKSSS